MREVARNIVLVPADIGDAVRLADRAISHGSGCQKELLPQTIESANFIRKDIGPQVGLVSYETRLTIPNQGNEANGESFTLSWTRLSNNYQNLMPPCFVGDSTSKSHPDQ